MFDLYMIEDMFLEVYIMLLSLREIWLRLLRLKRRGGGNILERVERNLKLRGRVSVFSTCLIYEETDDSQR